jgi:hypothetical protein
MALYATEGSANKVANALGCNRRSIDKIVNRVKRHAAAAGYAPEQDFVNAAKPGFSIERTTELQGADGQRKLMWIREKKVKAEEHDPCWEQYLTVYPMGDPHIGMYSWAAETGDDFDTDMATKQLVAAMRLLVDASPPSARCLIINLGDFFHSDTLDNQTRRSGHALDVDTRISRVWALGMTAMIACIDAARHKHKHVTVRNEIGNHDDHTSMLLGLALEAYFKDEPRVHIDTSPAKFFYYRFGKCLIGTTHGDTAKFPKLQGIMAADRPKDWGKTVHRYWYTGHFHTSKIEEYPGVLCEQFRTLAAKDAWTAGAGYRSGRDMRAIVMHEKDGEVERYRKDIRQVKKAVEKGK